MGTFYQAVHVRHPDDADVRRVLKSTADQLKFRCWVAPRCNAWVTLFPTGDVSVAALARLLSKQLGGEVLATLVHDSDVFCYTLARAGEEVDDFASNPDYFQEAPVEVRLRARGEPARITHLLSNGFARADLDSWFAQRAATSPESLMSRFHELLGIGPALTSYEYLERGEREGIAQWSKFFHVPDLAAEEAARKAERDQIAGAKRTLMKRGVLLFDSTVGRNRKAFQDVAVHGPHPAGGFVCSHFGDVTSLAHWRPPELPQALGFGPDHIARFGAGARWLDAATVVVETTNSRFAVNVLTGEQRPFHPEVKAALVAVDPESAIAYFVSREELLGIDLHNGATRFVVPHEFTGYRAFVHPTEPHLILSSEPGLRIFDKRSGAEITRLAMFNAANVERRAEQWRAQGVDPTVVPSLDHESLLTLVVTPDGQFLLAGTSEGLRVYRYADVAAARDRMPPAVFAVETTRELQDFRWVHAIAIDGARNVAIFSRGDDSLHALSLPTGEVRELFAGLDRARLFRLTIGGDVVAAFRRGYLDMKRREDEFSHQAWSISALLERSD